MGANAKRARFTAKGRSEALARHMAGLRLDGEAERRLAATAGVSLRVWRRAACAHPVAADAHMAICAVLFLDPVWLKASTAPRPAGPVCWATLGAGVRVTREMRGHGVREAAKAAGVSAATISRCENGRVLSFDGLARLAAYVGPHPRQYTVAIPDRPAAVRDDGRGSSTGNTHCNSLKLQEAGDA
ncbi:helix-turn-helix domain-containing protein [Ancylobacter polymorphus]|uniref:Helix-turn-helix domain-containing protein n=1 Tax=Ancylobacter polymorphus TaxID=223390 RepID=A0A9E7D738_9HYPH|nr:helix-turn-helix domain-containing protein [Ancylobacter polymorphus]UOK72995.1 helix-turn-helix domain-containing protein [Ancylobacter polymorphus]